jgi:uncharacterized membrane protein (DUF4010 family)
MFNLAPLDLTTLAIAVGLGLIVGLQREWAEEAVAGARTFAIITLFGALSAMLALEFGGWVIALAIVAVAGTLLMGNVVLLRNGHVSPGMTTEIAAVTMFTVGALLPLGHTAVAIVASGVIAILLQWKRPLHAFVRKLSQRDVQATMRLVLIALVILPILPDRGFGPYQVINPHQIWLMVVLIVGISLAAHLAHRVLGERVGTVLAGVLGGLISSTATTVSYARQSRVQPRVSGMAAIVIVIASTVVIARVLLEISIVAPELLRSTAPPLVILGLFMAVISFAAFHFMSHELAEGPDREAPSNLRAAIVFGLLYGAVLFAVAAAKERFGDAGLYAVAALSGLTDMDAITLSTAHMMKSGGIGADIGWRLILVGTASNLMFKATAVAVLGSRRLTGRIALLFGLTVSGAVLLFFLWP